MAPQFPARSPLPVGSSPEARSNTAVSGTTSAHARSTLRDDVRVAIEAAWASAARAGALPAGPDAVDVTVDVERPANAEHGDLATNLALRLARPLRTAPAAIAAVITEALVAGAASKVGGA